MLILKYLIISFFIYLSLLFSSIYFYFDDITNAIIIKDKKIRNLEIDNFKNSIKPLILNNQYTNARKLLDNFSASNKYQYIKLNYIEYYLTNKSILIHANKSVDMSWQLNDVTTDAKYGIILPFTSTIFKVTSAAMYDFEDGIFLVKSQAENQDRTINIISSINYTLPQYKNKDIKEDDFFTKQLKYILPVKNKDKIISFYINNIEYSNIVYKDNYNDLYNNIKTILIEFFTYYNILYIVLVIIYLLFNYIIMQKTTNRHLKQLEKYTDDILNNNFYKFDIDKLIYNDIKSVAGNISKLSKKMANIINELNVNKNVLELKVSTDNLTNLSNNKIFELEMKNLFLYKVPSYIVKIKLVCLSSYSNNNTSSQIDNLILNFVKKINNSIEKNDYEINLYRLYGGEFFLIVKDVDFEIMNKFLNELSNNIVTIANEFNITSKVSHMISIPFDHYSNTKELLNKINLIYSKTIKNPQQVSFYHEDNKKQNEDNKKLSKIVNSIINTSAFTLSYKFDTYSYVNNTLVMKEVSPNLINYDGSKIPIGTFISIATELKSAIEFDKDVIEKSFSFIEQNNNDYILAVNISIDAMNDDKFITWLESKLLYDYQDIRNKIVFSITSFAAKNNFNSFIKFSNNIKRFKGQIILKRFNYNDLTLDQLEKLNLNYIRVHSDYTNDIDKHKESILRNISDFCLVNNINLLADVVINDKDHQILKTLNFYGTSREG